MKTKWTIMMVSLLVAMLVSAPALADRYRYGYKHNSGHHRHYHHDHFYWGGDLFIGTMLGFALGALLASPPPPPPVYIYREYPPIVIYREKYVYIPPPKGIRQEPFSARNRTLPIDASCLQTREYTTTIVIKGRTVEAYGTKCLHTDGNWRYGPAQPVPDN